MPRESSLDIRYSNLLIDLSTAGVDPLQALDRPVQVRFIEIWGDTT